MPADHARVKQLFLAAVEMPEDERAGFLRNECGDDQDLHSEVEALLAHHSSKTIFVEPLPQPPATPAPHSKVRPGLPSGDSASVASGREIAKETESLLRSRLMAVTLVFSVGIATSVLIGLVGWRQGSLIAHVGSASIMLASYWYLRQSKQIGIMQLRAVELLILVTAALVTVYYDWYQISTAAFGDDENEAILQAVIAANSVYLTWSLVIFVYGVFMPNTWQRAAWILIPAAFFPHAITLAARWSDPKIAEILTYERIDESILAPLIAAGVSIYAAYIIHRVRLAAIHARRLAQYRLKRRIGEGGMGEVYEAEHLLLKRRCAIKLIRDEFSANSRTVARFEREVKATAALTHPNTIEIFDYGKTDEGTFYYVMELLPGMSLQELVDRHGPLSPARTIFFLRQACSALSEAHAAGLIHRDVKPANIFSAERGGLFDFLKLLDFGMVRETKIESDLTGVNTIGGTPLYMSPEQAFDTSKASEFSDLYALGAVGYFLLTGQPPFSGSSVVEILIAHSSQQVAPPSSLVDGIPQDLDDVIVRCLSKMPSHRYESAAALNSALDACGCRDQWTRSDASAWWAKHEAQSTAPSESKDTV